MPIGTRFTVKSDRYKGAVYECVDFPHLKPRQYPKEDKGWTIHYGDNDPGPSFCDAADHYGARTDGKRVIFKVVKECEEVAKMKLDRHIKRIVDAGERLKRAIENLDDEYEDYKSELLGTIQDVDAGIVAASFMDEIRSHRAVVCGCRENVEALIALKETTRKAIERFKQ